MSLLRKTSKKTISFQKNSDDLSPYFTFCIVSTVLYFVTTLVLVFAKNEKGSLDNHLILLASASGINFLFYGYSTIIVCALYLKFKVNSQNESNNKKELVNLFNTKTLK